MLFAPAAGFARGFPDAVVYVACGTAAAFWLLVAPRWLAAGWPAARLAAQIRADGIDLLVDLKGHTEGAATAVLAQRPDIVIETHVERYLVSW